MERLLELGHANRGRQLYHSVCQLFLGGAIGNVRLQPGRGRYDVARRRWCQWRFLSEEQGAEHAANGGKNGAGYKHYNKPKYH